MKKKSFILLIFVFVFSGCVQETIKEGQDILDSESGGLSNSINSLGHSELTANSATIEWKTKKEAQVQVAYGTSSIKENMKKTGFKKYGAKGSYELNQLQPSAQYFYYITARDKFGYEKSSELQSFTTAALTCVQGLPSLHLNQSSFSGVAGDSFSISGTLKNNNQNCSARTFSFSLQGAPSGLSLSFSNISLASGETKSFSGSVSSTASLAAANYSFALRATSGTVSAQKSLSVEIEEVVNSNEPEAPLLESVNHSNGNYTLVFSQPSSSLAPAGGYDTYINGVDQNDNASYSGFSRVLTGLDNQVQQCFKFEARYTQLSPKQFLQSNEICVEAQVVADTQAPSVPTNLNQLSVSSSSVVFSWSASTDNNAVSSYVIERDGSVIGNSNSANYTAAGLSASTTYSFRVAARDAAGNQSAFSSPLSITTSAPVVSQGLKAFPTAIGAGANATGGRGGQVIHVTNLAASGPGSFLEALQTEGPRIIVFDVGGTIRITGWEWSNFIETTASSNYDNLTIAGQTAPGGITIETDFFRFSNVNNLIMRYIRISLKPTNYFSLDAMWYGNSNNAIFDHCTFVHGRDEAFSATAIGGGNLIGDITVQRSLFGNSKTGTILGSHGGDGGDYTYAYNAAINIAHRFPNTKEETGGQFDVYNNVVYNYKNRLMRISASSHLVKINYINNYIKPSQYYIDRWGIHPKKMNKVQMSGLPAANSQIYSGGNILEDRFDTPQENDWLLWSDFTGSDSTAPYVPAGYFVTQQHSLAGVAGNILSAQDAYSNVLGNVGANRYISDSNLAAAYTNVVDQDLITQALTDSATAFGGLQADQIVYPTLVMQTRPAGYDTDRDGMPNAWEIANGLNPNLDDSAGDADGDGYTNIEEFLNIIDQ